MPERKIKSDFEVMQEMSDVNEDISMSPHFVSAVKCKQGAHVTMGIDEAALFKLMNNESICALYIINKDQFFKRKNQTS